MGMLVDACPDEDGATLVPRWRWSPRIGIARSQQLGRRDTRDVPENGNSAAENSRLPEDGTCSPARRRDGEEVEERRELDHWPRV